MAAYLGPSDAEIAAQFALEKGAGLAINAAYNATIGPAVNAAVNSAWTSIFGSAAAAEAAVGGGAAAGAAAATGGAAGAMAGAMSVMGPAGIALAVAMFFSAIGPDTEYRREIDASRIEFVDGKFTTVRETRAGDDNTGLMSDYISERLNTYYAARPFDLNAYIANDPYRQQTFDENGLPTVPVVDRSSHVADITRFVPDVRDPRVGYGVGNGWSDDALYLADPDDAANATLRRVLLRAGESPESIDAFIGGSTAGAAGGLPHLASYGIEYGGGQEGAGAVRGLEDLLLHAPDAEVRDQRREFTPLSSYAAAAPAAEAAATPVAPAAPAADPLVPEWLKGWKYAGDKPTAKPEGIADTLWTAWESATPEEQASAWRVIGADDWRTLQGVGG